MAWKERRLALTRLRFQAFGGRFRGRFHADFQGEEPQYQCTGNLKEISLAQFLRTTTTLGELFSGRLGADVVLQTTGRRPVDWRHNLQGTVAGVITDGRLTHIDLLAAMSAAAGLTRAGRTGEGATELQSLAGEFEIGERRVRFEGTRMIVDGAALELAGEVDFDAKINLRLRGELLRVAEAKRMSTLRRLFDSTYQLRGTLKEPSVRVLETSSTAQP